jgi:hypothetical protein
MDEKTTERRQKDEFVVLKMTSLQYSSRETNPFASFPTRLDQVEEMFALCVNGCLEQVDTCSGPGSKGPVLS